MTTGNEKQASQTKVTETKVEGPDGKEVMVNLTEYMTFADASKELGVRFQQVYQRAVMRNKMRWVYDGKRKLVRKQDVAEWAKVRKQYFASKAE